MDEHTVEFKPLLDLSPNLDVIIGHLLIVRFGVRGVLLRYVRCVLRALLRYVCCCAALRALLYCAPCISALRSQLTPHHLSDCC